MDPVLRLKMPTGEVHDLPLSVEIEDREYVLAVDLPGQGPLRVRGPDQFECLLRLRTELEPLGYRTLVNGARLDVWPSGMARQMAAGRKCYVLTMGIH